MDSLVLTVEKLHKEGTALQKRAISILRRRAKLEEEAKMDASEVENAVKKFHGNFMIDIKKWLNKLSATVLPKTIFDDQYLIYAMNNILSGMKDTVGGLGVAEQRIDNSFEGIFELIESALISEKNLPHEESLVYKPNTAFIMMWMDKQHFELEDVSNTIKGVCNDFNIAAVRADDIEHQGKITEIILEQIRSSQFLLGDVSGERPNVYYEIGFAHALGKNPILYRRKGTKLHFDLSVHNIPEYKNITELRFLLTKRFEAILGRQAG